MSSGSNNLLGGQHLDTQRRNHVTDLRIIKKFRNLQANTSIALEVHCDAGPVPMKVALRIPFGRPAILMRTTAKYSRSIASMNAPDICEKTETRTLAVTALKTTLPTCI
jgi:hypothetical protein